MMVYILLKQRIMKSYIEPAAFITFFYSNKLYVHFKSSPLVLCLSKINLLLKSSIKSHFKPLVAFIYFHFMVTNYISISNPPL